jgi:pimeloyl-ACP methyl ester carboxylesterase
MSSHPVYVPTSGRPVAGIVHLPDEARSRAPAIALFSGLNAERIRIGAVRTAALALADAGHIVLRIDHPGAGTSPGPPPDRASATGLLHEVLVWFRSVTDGAPLAVGGTCAGGGHALQLAALDPSIVRVVIQGGRLRPTVGKERPTVAAALAAVDVLDRLPASVVKHRGSSALYDESSWHAERLAELEHASRHARLTFICGRDDAAHKDLEALLASDVISERARLAIEVRPLESDRINTVTDIAQHESLSRALVDSLACPPDR